MRIDVRSGQDVVAYQIVGDVPGIDARGARPPQEHSPRRPRRHIAAPVSVLELIPAPTAHGVDPRRQRQYRLTK